MCLAKMNRNNLFNKYIFSLILLLVVLTMACLSNTYSPASPEKSPDSRTPLVVTEKGRIDWNSTLRTAKKEGTVVVYGAFGLAQARDPLIKTFSAKFGINLEMIIAQGPQLTARLVNERRAGLYLADVYIGGPESILNDLIPRNMLESIEPHFIVPEVNDPTKWFMGNLPFFDTGKLTISTLANIPNSKSVINTNFLKTDEFKSYEDLLKPKIKSLIVMADPTVPGGAYWFHIATKIMGEDYMRKLVKQDIVITRDFRLMTEWLVKGKFIVGIAVDSAGIKAAIRDGAPVSFLTLFKEGSDMGPGGGIIGVMNNNPHPHATKIFVNWILNQEGQTILSKATNMASRRTDVATDHLEPWMVPNPAIKYINHNEISVKEQIAKLELAKEIFAPLLK